MKRNTPPPRFELLEGDALALLRTLPPDSVDVILADPPYSSGARRLNERQRPPNSKYANEPRFPEFYGDARDQRSFVCWSTLWLAAAFRVARPGAVAMVFSDWRQLPALSDAFQAGGWSWGGIVVWDKANARPHPGRFRSQCEFVLWGAKGKLPGAPGPYLPGIFRQAVRPGERLHITPKPVELLKSLLEIAPEGGVVLDPFIGAGATALAALETGRSCIGIELSPEYAQITRERVAAAFPGHLKANVALA